MNNICRIARYLNILTGVILMGTGIVFMITEAAAVPLASFYLAFSAIIGGLYFLVLRPDKKCFTY